jgi:hypothetical protein
MKRKIDIGLLFPCSQIPFKNSLNFKLELSCCQKFRFSEWPSIVLKFSLNCIVVNMRFADLKSSTDLYNLLPKNRLTSGCIECSKASTPQVSHVVLATTCRNLVGRTIWCHDGREMTTVAQSAWFDATDNTGADSFKAHDT